MIDDFVIPDPNAPLDLAERLAQLPAQATVKGMFFQTMSDQAFVASGQLPGRDRYVAYKDYPLREWIELLLKAARLTFPRVPVREGIRRLGQESYPTFTRSMVGKVLMAAAGNNFGAALRLAPRAFFLTSSTTRCQVVAMEETRAELRLVRAWDFTEALHVGVFEGTMRAFQRKGVVRVRILSLSSADFEITWT
jgi:uncharacterized protein (TIGR02265 family)